MTDDERNLDLLAMLHYVWGGLNELFSCFLVILTRDSARQAFAAGLPPRVGRSGEARAQNRLPAVLDNSRMISIMAQ